MVKHTLYMATYERGRYAVSGETKPYHWSYFVHVDPAASGMQGIAHQLRGMPGGFYYRGPESVDLTKSGSLKEKIEIGEVDEAQLDRIHDILKDLRIESVESSKWNCQDWALDGLTKLRDAGYVYDYMTNDAVKSWLREQ